MRFEFIAAFEEHQLDQDGDAGHAGAGFLHQLAGRLHGAAGRQQVVNDQDARVLDEAVHMYLQFRVAIFQIVLKGVRAIRELSRLAQRDKGAVQLQGQGCGKQKPARLRGAHRIGRLGLVTAVHQVHGFLKGLGIGQKRGDILEKYAGLGKIGNIANKAGQIHRRLLCNVCLKQRLLIFTRQGNMPIHVREATLADAEVVIEFNRLLALESEGKVLPPELLVPGVKACLADPAKGRYFLAEEDGAILGQMGISYEWSDWRNGMFWWIQSVYVRPESRRRGVFGAIFEYIEEAARRDPDLVGLRLYVEENNHTALKTYFRIGFERTGYIVLEKYPL
jgi:GNAT superfamily N-acetyltransferase